MENKKGQITIFVIIAILLILGVAVYFLVRNNFPSSNIPQNIEPLYEDFLRCLEDDTSSGIAILGAQGGYIKTPEFEQGSQYMPSSSQLDFLGTSVPYWYYISGNNIQKEQVPTVSEMEKQLEDYIEKQIITCDLTEKYNKGFEVEFGEPRADVKISDSKVDVNLNFQMGVTKGEDSAVINSHKISVGSKIGNFYNYARKIYSNERKNKFLEDYGVDVLRLYAPVDGMELTCSPKVWSQNDVKTKLVEALEANTQTIKIKGDYYSLSAKENKYFVQDIGEDANNKNVNFLYSPGWPTKIEVYPDDNPMIAEPMGNQAGLGILGFCYVPYHFVYDFTYPVLIQVYDEEELFQFPVAVVIDKNLPIEGEVGEEINSENQLCKYKNQKVDVYTYDTELNSIEADVSFECLGTSCDIGKTEGTDAHLEGMFPKCVNSYISAEADGYVTKRVLQSTNEPSTVNIVLDKLYEVPYTLNVDGRESSDFAIINFISEENSNTIVWPETKTIKLSEGSYNISVYVYKNSTINLPGINEQKCSEVPKTGILGILGMTEEKCIDINLPSQKVSNVISGGGKGQDYIIESQLENGKLNINVNSIPLPKNLEGLQDGYNRLEVQGVYLNFE